MKNVGRYIAISGVALVLIPGGAAVAAACSPAPAAEFARPAVLAYPSFCSIPATPKDIRPAAAFRSAVVRTRLAGASVVRQSGPESFSLSGTEAFAEGAKRTATAPPAMTSSETADAEAFAAAARARAAPPKRHRRH